FAVDTSHSRQAMNFLPVNFGLSGYTGMAMYLGAIVCFLLAVFRRPIIGIYFLIPLLPLQTIRYRLNEFPLGGSIIGVMLLGVTLGILKQRRPLFPKTPFTTILVLFGVYTFISLWQGSFYLDSDLPLPGNPR